MHFDNPVVNLWTVGPKNFWLLSKKRERQNLQRQILPSEGFCGHVDCTFDNPAGKVCQNDKLKVIFFQRRKNSLGKVPMDMQIAVLTTKSKHYQQRDKKVRSDVRSSKN